MEKQPLVLKVKFGRADVLKFYSGGMVGPSMWVTVDDGPPISFEHDAFVEIPRGGYDDYSELIVKVYGDFPYGFMFYPEGQWQCVEEVLSWGEYEVSRFTLATANGPTAVPDIAPPNTKDLSYLFQGVYNVPRNIAQWDVSHVENMSGMFQHCYSFDTDISGWDVSSVKSMSAMFMGTSFNQDIGGWDVSAVEQMNYMFKDAGYFNQDLSGWDVRRITEEPEEFSNGADSWTLPKPVWGGGGDSSESYQWELEKTFRMVSYDPGYPPTPEVPGYWADIWLGETCRSEVIRQLVEIQRGRDWVTGEAWVENVYGYVTRVVCDQRWTKRWIPPVPAKPGKLPTTEWDMYPGWNAGARSIDSAYPTVPESRWIDLAEPVIPAFQFTVSPDAIGVVVGLSDVESPTHPDHILVGVRVESGMARVVIPEGMVWEDAPPWSGVQKTTKDDKFIIEMYADGLRIGGLGGWGWLPMVVTGSLHLGAVMYLGNDKVLTADHTPAHGVQYDADLPMVVGEAWSGDLVWQIADLPAVNGGGGIFSGSAGVLPAMHGDGILMPRGAAYGYGELPAVTSMGVMDAQENVPNNPTGYQVGAELSPVIGVGITRAGWNARQDEGGDLPSAQSIGGVGIAPGVQDVGLLPALVTYAFADPPGVPCYVGSAAVGWNDLYAHTHLVAVVSSRGTLKALLDVQQMVGVAVDSLAQGAARWQLDAALLAFVDSVVQGAASVGGRGQAVSGDPDRLVDFDAGDQVWVLNARTGAVSRYQNYSFNSFALIGGHYFGADEGGIYLLEGELDGEAPIHTRIQTGQMDLGSKQLKHVSNVYLGVASDGVLSVTVQANCQQYTYQARRGDPHSQQQRVDTGKGLRATLYGFELVNCQPFELDSMDINVVQSGRRI